MSSGGSTQNDDVIKSKPKLDERKSAPNANAKPAANRSNIVCSFFEYCLCTIIGR